MFKQSPRRNQRNNKGVKVKHVVQICVLLGVCIWLLYEVPRPTSSSHETIRISEKLQYPTDIKLGRKDLQPRTEEDENEKPREEGFVAFDDENKPTDTSRDKSYGDETVDEGRGKEAKEDEDNNERNDAKERAEDESKEKTGEKVKQSEEEATEEKESKNEESKEQEEKAEDDKLDESSSADEVKNSENNEEQVEVESSKYASGPDYDSAKGQSGKSSTENEDTKIDEKKIFFNDTNSDEMVESKLKKLIKEDQPMSSSERVDTVVNDQVDLSGLLPEVVREARADLDTLPEAGNEVNNAE